MTTVSDGLFQYGGQPVGSPHPGRQPQKAYFVDGHKGVAGAPGDRWGRAVKTIQAGIDLANVPNNKYIDTDIYIASGTYTEEAYVSPYPQPALSGGVYHGLFGKLRLIATGSVYLTNGASATKPALTMGRTNTDVIGFDMIRNDTDVAAGAWSMPFGSGAGAGSTLVGLPALLIDRTYDGDTVLYGDAFHNGVYNCTICGGAFECALLVNGPHWCTFHDLIVEYGTYGVAVVGSSIGAPANHVFRRITFRENTYDFGHQHNTHTYIYDSNFVDDGATKHLIRIGAAGAVGCAVIGGAVTAEAKLVDATNGNWIASGVGDTDSNGIFGNTDLAN